MVFQALSSHTSYHASNFPLVNWAGTRRACALFSQSQQLATFDTYIFYAQHQLENNVVKWNCTYPQPSCSDMFFTGLFLCSTFQACHEPPWTLQKQKEECACFLYPLANLVLLFPFFKPKAQLHTTQLGCCYTRNDIWKLGLDFNSAGSTFCESCLCPYPSQEQE